MSSPRSGDGYLDRSYGNGSSGMHFDIGRSPRIVHVCRTAALGGHRGSDATQCGHRAISLQLVPYGEYFLMGSSAPESTLGWPFRPD